MTHVSKKKLDFTTNKLLNTLLTSTLANLPGKDTTDILSTIFSKTEITMIKKRLAIILLLGLGLDTGKISEEVKITRQTVDRIRLQLELLPNDQKVKLISRLKKTFVKEGLIDFLKNLDLSKGAILKKLNEPWF